MEQDVLARGASERISAHAAMVGEGLPIHRALPARQRRRVGAWCFLDHMGPADVSTGRGLRVAPHPHLGLQTVTWLLRGEILHRDSLGTVQLIRPGQLNLMTSGRAISHSEESPAQRTSDMHGVQFWIALPESARHGEPLFDHHAVLPVTEREGLRITVIAGEALGERSPARIFTPLVGLDIAAQAGGCATLPLREDFEYAALVLQGEAAIAGEALAPDELLYLGRGRSQLALRTAPGSRLMLIGGAPFGEETLMWWNFVGRSKDELVRACREWNAGQGGFGQVQGYDGERLLAPLPPWAA
jgi:redox-sensitive bicupin YhaK (pirin superfamily)